VTFKRGGQPGRVAINADRVTDIRSSAGPFTDVHCGAHRITVEGSFEQLVAKIAGAATAAAGSPAGPFARVA